MTRPNIELNRQRQKDLQSTVRIAQQENGSIILTIGMRMTVLSNCQALQLKVWELCAIDKNKFCDFYNK